MICVDLPAGLFMVGLAAGFFITFEAGILWLKEVLDQAMHQGLKDDVAQAVLLNEAPQGSKRV